MGADSALLALPSLAAVLRQNGIETVLKDINVEMYDHIFTPGFLLFVKGKIQDRLKELKKNEANLNVEDRELKQMLSDYQHIDLDYHIQKVGRAKEIMRSEEFYEVEKSEWALNAFREVMEYVSVAYFPASTSFTLLKVILIYTAPGFPKICSKYPSTTKSTCMQISVDNWF